jgi:competence protein ComEC
MSADVRVDGALALSGALVAGGIAFVAPGEVVLVSASLLGFLLLSRRRSGPRWAALALAIASGLAAGHARAAHAVSVHEAARAKAELSLGAPQRCSARARVLSSPVRVRDAVRWDAHLSGLVCESGPASWEGDATLYGGPGDLARGDDVDVVATLGSPQRLWNEAAGDPRPAEAHRGIVRSGGTLDVRFVRRARGLLASIDRARAGLRGRIDATFAGDIGPMARALVLGESDLSPDDDRCFRASGLSHLLAVSGMHLVLVLALVVRTLEASLARVEAVAARCDVGRVAAALGVPVAWVYAELAGAGGSTTRAAWMATVALVARALGRRTDVARAFGLSMGAMALGDPLVAFDLSFLLSAAATGGLLAFASPFGRRFARWVPVRSALASGVARAAATTLAASIPCVPILARFAPTVPLGGVLANLLAVPVGEGAALPLCLAHALLSWWPAAELGCARAASGALVLVRGVARAFATPALTAEIPQPTSWQLAVIAIGTAAILLLRQRRVAMVAACAAATLLLEAGARRAGVPHGELRATFLDVGQGDSAIVDLPDGQAMVIDGGGLVGSPVDVGTRVLAPELRARRRSELAAAVLTHPHPDHYGGLATGLDSVRLGSFWDSGQGETERVGGAYEGMLRALRARGVPILHPEALCGSREVGGARVEVLAPCPVFSSDVGPNDNSFALRIAFGSRALLFVGDAEREEESKLLQTARNRLRADVLKVGHHGSATSSSPAFIAAVAPREAIISAGCRNRFGHPSPSTLATLAAAGARVWRTDRDGAVVVTTDGTSLATRALAVRVRDDAARDPVDASGR